MSDNEIKQLKRDKKPWKVFRVSLWVFFCSLAVSLQRLVSWTFQNWGNLKADELIYTLTANLSGTNTAMVKSGIFYCIPPAILTGIVVLLLYLYVSKKGPRPKKILMVSGVVVSSLIIIVSGWYFFHEIDFVSYVQNQNQYSTFVDENYVDPDSVQITFPEKKRNLIYLYIESMEVSFADVEHGGGKSQNLIPELTELGLVAETFSGSSEILNGAYSLHGSTYTMGGLFAQMTGLPLTFNQDQIQLSESFVPGVVALGDILEEADYHNVFCIGTDAAFADRDKYFIEHGDYTIYDYNYSLKNREITSDYARDFWGYDDFILYENAKQHLLELAKADQPFNFTMLTVDSHAEDGYLCEMCGNKYDDKYSNVMACASAQAADFVKWIQEQDFYENTTIVLAGDHCTMDSDFCDNMPQDYERRVYTIFLNPASEVSPAADQFRKYSTMDLFPTTLGALGVQIEGERLGLGTNLFSEEKTLMEQYDIATMNTNLAQKSVFLEGTLGSEKAPVSFELNYDDTTGSIQLVLEDNISYSGAYDGLVCMLNHEATGINYTFELEKEGNYYTADMSLQNLYYQPGEYKGHVYLVLPDKLQKWYATASVNVKKVKYTPPVNFQLSNDGESLDITLDKKIGESYSNIWLAIWSDENGQDDLAWHILDQQSLKQPKTIDLSAHTKEGELIVHIYGGEEEPEECIQMITVPLSKLSAMNRK